PTGRRHARPISRDRPDDRTPLRDLRTQRHPRATLSSRQLRWERSLLRSGCRGVEARRDNDPRTKVLGFPFQDISQMPAGDYYVQALLNVYTQYHRADGHTIWVHADQWEGQQWNSSPGNLVSEVVKVHFDPAAHTTVKLALTKKLPPAESPADTRWVKHIKMKSELLSKFWGAPVYIGATVLVPNGFDESSTARYPAVYSQGHFGLGAPFGFV